jgi:hypothetical protein
VASAQVEHLLRPFCRRIAVGVSLTDGTEGLFDAALPRDDDADGTPRPDLSLADGPGAAPVVGVILAHPQPEYGARQRHDEAERRVRALVRRAGVAPLPLDTRLALLATPAWAVSGRAADAAGGAPAPGASPPRAAG